MAKHKGHLDKLDKSVRDRHFPELHGGKGSHRRKSTTDSRAAFENNYDKIFGKKSQ